MPQVSLVLNIHNESRYLVRTLRSLEHAVRFARREGIDSELVVVMDRPDIATERMARDYDYSVFGETRLLKVDNGSLGPSRNDGIAEAKGRYAWLCDGDDLVSYNALARMYWRAEKWPGPCVVFPQYLLSFGDAYFLTRYEGTDAFPHLDFVASHPFVSRSFALRETFAQTPFADLRLSKGFAYEDWHFNATAYAKGCECLVAEQTILFYRQREGSLLRAANAMSARRIPHAPLFDPEVYLARTARSAEIRSSGTAPISTIRSLLDDDVCMEMVWDAAQIDPAIDVAAVERGGEYANVVNPVEPGAVYRSLCELVAGCVFSDVALVSAPHPGDGEAYLADLLGALASVNPSSLSLVIVVDDGLPPARLRGFPAGTVIVDLPALASPLYDEQRYVVLLRLLLACASTARLHLTGGAFAHAFFQRSRECLDSMRTYYYRFGEPVRPLAGRLYPAGAGFEFISSNLDRLAGVISDSREAIEYAERRFGCRLANWHCIYPLREAASGAASRPLESDIGAAWRRRLLWASPMTPEKRVKLLPRLAERLRQEWPDVRLQVCAIEGGSGFDPAELQGAPNVDYHGMVCSIDELPIAECDAFVYTSLYDSTPRILLEMMAVGLPVIAADVGGIPETVVDGTTGYLVRSSASDDEIIERYLDAVRRLYEDPDAAAATAHRARELVENRHGVEAFRRRVADVFLDGVK